MPRPASTRRAGSVAALQPPTVSSQGETQLHQQKIPVLPRKTAPSTIQGPGLPRKRNCPARPASATASILRHEPPDEQERAERPDGHEDKRGAPAHHAGQQRSEGHAEGVGQRLPQDHDGNRTALLALVGHGARGDGGGAKEGAVRHAGDEARHGEHAGAGCERGHGVAHEAQQHEGHEQALGGNVVAKDQDEGAKADADGVGGDEAAGLGHRDAYASGDVGDDAHEHELRKAQGKRAGGQCDQALLHA